MGLRVARLVDPELAAAWQTDEGQAAPILVVEGPLDCDSFGFELSRCGIDVLAEQVKLLAGLSGLGRMHRELGWRKRKDQPATPASTEPRPSTSLKNARSASASLLKMIA